MRSDRVEEFRNRLNAYAATRLTPEDFIPGLLVDAAVELREMTNQAAMEALALEPFGVGNPRPLFLAQGVEIAGEPTWMKEKHARFWVRQGDRGLRLKAWSFIERAAELKAGAKVDIVFELEEDAYSAARGYPGWSATLRDLAVNNQQSAIGKTTES